MDKELLKKLLPKAFADLNGLASSAMQSKVKGMYKPKAAVGMLEVDEKPLTEVEHPENYTSPHDQIENSKPRGLEAPIARKLESGEMDEAAEDMKSEENELAELKSGISDEDHELLMKLLMKK